MKDLFNLLKVPDIPASHWSQQAAWGLAESLDEVITDDLKVRLKESPFFAISVDESSAIDNTEYLSIQIYLLDAKCNRTCEFLCLAKINRTNAITITQSILESLEKYANISKKVLAERFIGFASDGASVMMGSNSGVASRLVSHHAPYMTSTHDFGHRVALGCGKLRDNALFSYIESTAKAIYAVFSRSHAQCEKLKLYQALTDCPLLAVLRVHDIRWLSIKGVLDNLSREYPALLLMFKDGVDAQSRYDKVFEGLSDVRFVVGPVLFEALLTELNKLSKKCQESDVLFDELGLAVEETISLITDRFIVEGPSQFSGTIIREFLDVKSNEYECSAGSPLFWKSKYSLWEDAMAGQQSPFGQQDLLRHETVLAYAIQGESNTDVELHYDGKKITNIAMFRDTIWKLMSETSSAAKAVVEDLVVRFPRRSLLDAFAILQPRFWGSRGEVGHAELQGIVKEKLDILVSTYSAKVSLPTVPIIIAPIDAKMLREQFDDFFLWMQGSATTDGTGVFWVNMFARPTAKYHISEFMKLAQIMLLIIVGSVENERVFSCLNLTKNPSRNKLDENHLNVCVRAKKCKWGISNFPYDLALGVWLDKVKRRGIDAVIAGNE
jgi:hypothetical protein